MNFAQRLQQLMDDKYISNYQLAKELGTHATSVANWLAGTEPRKAMQKKIADYFEVSVEYLLTGKDLEQKETPQAEAGGDNRIGIDLTPEEEDILDLYRNSDEQLRAAARSVLMTSQKNPDNKVSSSRPK